MAFRNTVIPLQRHLLTDYKATVVLILSSCAWRCMKKTTSAIIVAFSSCEISLKCLKNSMHHWFQYYHRKQRMLCARWKPNIESIKSKEDPVQVRLNRNQIWNLLTIQRIVATFYLTSTSASFSSNNGSENNIFRPTSNLRKTLPNCLTLRRRASV